MLFFLFGETKHVPFFAKFILHVCHLLVGIAFSRKAMSTWCNLRLVPVNVQCLSGNITLARSSILSCLPWAALGIWSWEATGGQGPGHRWGNIFVCGLNIDLIQCAWKDSRAPLGQGAFPLKLKHFLAYGRAMEVSHKLACFLIFENAKKLTNICVFLQKWRLVIHTLA